jgi:hypothetical protein
MPMTETTATVQTVPNPPTKIEAINADCVERVEAKLTKYNAKATKLGCPFTWSWGPERVVVRKVSIGFREETRKFLVRDLEIESVRPKLAGWEFLGTLAHSDVPGVVLRKMVPGVECPAELREVSPNRCDHCGTSRRRNDTFIVRHEDGSAKVVGRQCAADFLGGPATTWVVYNEIMASLVGIGDDEESVGGGGRWNEVWNTMEVLPLVFLVIRLDGGYVSRKQAEADLRTSTSEGVACLASPPWGSSEEARKAEAKRRETLEKLSIEDYDRAWACLTWLADQRPESDFMHNVLAVYACGYVTEKTLGIFCGGVAGYTREFAERVARDNRPSAHVGEVGKRQAFGVVSVVKCVSITSMWGDQSLVIMRDAAGNVLTTKTAADRLPECVFAGSQVSITKATVKEHDEYRGVAQTVLSRVVFEEVA